MTETFTEMRARTGREKEINGALGRLGSTGSKALHWDALLECRGTPGSIWSDTNPGGSAIPGTGRFAAFASPPDPMWRPQGTMVCARCGGTGFLDLHGVPNETLPCDRPSCTDGEAPLPRVYVGELEPSHRRNLYSWMMRRAPYLLGLHVSTWYSGPFGGPPDDIFDDMERWEEELSADPWSWLAARPFMLALGALLLGDGNGGTVAAWGRRAALLNTKDAKQRVQLAVSSVVIDGYLADHPQSRAEKEQSRWAALSGLGHDVG